MKSRSFKKVISLMLSLTIILSTALFITIVSNAYVPTSPTSVSGLRYEGEFKTYVYDGTVINLGYSESYALQALGNNYTLNMGYDQYGNIVYKQYQYPDITVTFAGISTITNIRSFSSNFKYAVTDPVNYTYVELTVGSSKSLVRSTYGESNLVASGSSYDEFVFGDKVVDIYYNGDIVRGFQVYDSDPYNFN